mmetsp:Transcript_63738/g.154130  ORF Transcript_63738/g.154130 Transcript_63738/m.154130 type:complete len:127 (-) Transcript_63738:227-607(-)
MVWRKEQVAEEAEAFVGSSEEGNTGSTQDSDEEDPRPCTKCGRMLAPDVEFCPKCGTRREDLDRRCCRCSCLRCCCCCWCYCCCRRSFRWHGPVGQPCYLCCCFCCRCGFRWQSRYCQRPRALNPF